MSEVVKKKYVRKPKLYISFLNKGWVRREILEKVLPEMQHTKSVRTFLEPLSVSWAEPIFGNRNRIARRFLNSKCDYLLMLDNDIVPLFNPAPFVHADKDILGFPAKVRQVGQVLNWVAYKEAKDDPGMYYPVDFSSIDMATYDFLNCDAVGTGCIMVRRNVIEELFKRANGNGWEAPFTISLTEWGEMMHGTDIAFCRRAKEAGFNVVSTINYVCEHYKEVGLLDIFGYDDSDYRDRSTGKYRIPWGGWAITQKDWAFIKPILLRDNIKTVLEFGAGLSTLLMSEVCKVVSYEQNVEWAKEIRKKAKKKRNNLEIRLWDGREMKDELPKFDLCFVDAPPSKAGGGIGRQHSMEVASKVADRIIVHDAGRGEEMMWQFIYLRNDFKMIEKNGHHQSRCQYWVRRTLLDEKPTNLTEAKGEVL